MISNKIINQIVDVILQNLNTIHSSGLYNGKAGLSLSLFAVSDHLQDKKKIEDVAYRLIQESLVIQNNNLSFENGLAGIGYSLLYLIENKHIKADFYEIFYAQYEMIIERLEKINTEPALLINSLKVIFFLFKISQIKNDVRTLNIIKHYFEGFEFFFAIQFRGFDDSCYMTKKTDILNTYNIYLKLIDYTKYAHFSRSLLNDYAALYRRGKIASSLESGYYLNKITDRNNIKGYEDIIDEQITNGIKNIYPFTLSLKEKIDFAKLMYYYSSESGKSDELSNMTIIKENDTIQSIIGIVDAKHHPLGYGAGLARLLSFCANKDIELL